MTFPWNLMKRGAGEHPALSDTVKGVIAAAAIWVGLALAISAYAYSMVLVARVVLVIGGAWLVAAGLAYVLAMSRPSATA